MSSPENEIDELMAAWVQGVHRKNWDSLRGLYTTDIVLFDVIPPISFTGAAVEAGFVEWFDWYDGPIHYQRTQVDVEVDREIAVSRSIDHVHGILCTGSSTDYWLRHTVVVRNTGAGWRIAHQHASVPVNLPSGDLDSGSVARVSP